MRLLLYCTKEKPYLYKTDDTMIEKMNGDYHTQLNEAVLTENLNGKIVAECDYDVEEIKKVNYDCILFTNTLGTEDLINKCGIDYFSLKEYLKPNWNKEDDLQNLDIVGYAIHIKNLHIFDKPKELSVYYNLAQNGNPLLAKTMQEVGIWEIYDPPVNGPEVEHFVGKFFIPVSSQEMCRIANGEQTALVRRRVLKEMLE